MALVPRPVCVKFHFESVSMGMSLTAKRSKHRVPAGLEAYKEEEDSGMGQYSSVVLSSSLLSFPFPVPPSFSFSPRLALVL